MLKKHLLLRKKHLMENKDIKLNDQLENKDLKLESINNNSNDQLEKTDIKLESINNNSNYLEKKEIKLESIVKINYHHEKTNNLKEIAIDKRKQFNKPIISVTGSCGKTTTCLLIYNIFKNYGFKINKSHENSNSGIGIVWNINNLFNLESDFWIQEIGIGKKNEMDQNLNIVKPNIRILTNIYDAHLENFLIKEDYYEEKLKFIRLSYPNSQIIVNNDNLLIKNEIKKDFYSKKKINIIRCGQLEDNDIRLVKYNLNNDNISSDYVIKIKYKNINEEISFNIKKK